VAESKKLVVGTVPVYEAPVPVPVVEGKGETPLTLGLVTGPIVLGVPMEDDAVELGGGVV
jgi:hypothetical protein